MTTALFVDWLGRGGIAQTTDVWRSTAEASGLDTVVVTRAGRELAGERVVAPRSWRSSLVDHASVARAAVSTIRNVRPDVVVIQNYVLPFMEAPVHRAARQVGARTIFVIHNHRPHSRLAGSSAGIDRLAALADVVVTHSEYVRRHIHAGHVAILPLPPSPAALAASQHPVNGAGDELRAIHFGVLVRRYKGTDLVAEIAERSPAAWRFSAVGVGATNTARVEATGHFVPVDDLAARVADAHVALLPYRYATQSASVLFAQAVGAVPVASAVGGIPEQIVHGRTGLLVPPDTGSAGWLALLSEFGDPLVQRAMSSAAKQAAVASDKAFRTRAAEILQ